MSDFNGKAKKKPLLCVILQAEGVLSEAQAERALAAWYGRQECGNRTSFGQVVLSLGLVSPGTLGAYIEMQRQLAGTPGKPPLGVMLIEHGVLKPRQVLDALKCTRPTGKRLGEFLIQEGLVRRIQVDMMLQTQKRMTAQLVA